MLVQKHCKCTYNGFAHNIDFVIKSNQKYWETNILHFMNITLSVFPN